MDKTPDLSALSATQLRTMVAELMTGIGERDQHIAERDAVLVSRDEAIKRYRLREQQLTHEIALLRRYRFGRRSEGLDRHQLDLLKEQIDEDIAAIETEFDTHPDRDKKATTKQKPPSRQSLPPQLARTDIHHEPDLTRCSCGCQMKRIGEDISEKLDYQPGTFSVERHIRGKWSCANCETLVQKPVAAHIIDKGIPTTGLLAQVLVSKYADHLPLYRQQQIYARAGVNLPRSTLSDWVGRCGVELAPLVDCLRHALKQQHILHADETPVAMLAPGRKRTHTAYVWAYAATRFARVQGVVYDFQASRSGKAARAFLDGWCGKLVCDDYSGYKASFREGITEI